MMDAPGSIPFPGSEHARSGFVSRTNGRRSNRLSLEGKELATCAIRRQQRHLVATLDTAA
jgi:hypothetical protein